MATDANVSQTILRGLLRQLPAEFHSALDYQFFNLPSRYFKTLDMKAIQADLRLISKIHGAQAIVSICDLNDKLTIQVIVEKDEPRIFLRVVSVLASHGINILEAAIFTGKKDSMVVDHFVVDNRANRAVLDRACREIRDSLVQTKSVEPLLPNPDNSGLLVMCSQFNADHTLVTVAARDQIGFLYRVARVFAELDLRLKYAEIKTRDDHIVDTFYVVTAQGVKLDNAKVADLRSAVNVAFAS